MASTPINDKKKILSPTQENAVFGPASHVAKSAGAVAGASLAGPAGAMVGAAIAEKAAPLMVKAANTVSSKAVAMVAELKIKPPQASTSSVAPLMPTAYKSPTPRPE